MTTSPVILAALTSSKFAVGQGLPLLRHRASVNCVVIDPSLDLDQYLETAERYGWEITHVLDTHLHADHISGARALVEATGAVLMLSPNDPFTFDFEPLSDGRSIELAPGVQLTVSAVSVPGHTEGSTMYHWVIRPFYW